MEYKYSINKAGSEYVLDWAQNPREALEKLTDYQANTASFMWVDAIDVVDNKVIVAGLSHRNLKALAKNAKLIEHFPSHSVLTGRVQRIVNNKLVDE